MSTNQFSTLAQQKYLDILFDECQFTFLQKRALLKSDYGVSFVDQLTVGQARILIEEMKRLKGDRMEREKVKKENANRD